MSGVEEVSVYETPDPGDPGYTDPQPPPPQYESEFISSEEIDAEQARSVFDRYECNTNRTDFSSIRKQGWRSGLRQETSAERLARIRRELEEFKAEDMNVQDLESSLSALSTRERIVSPSGATSPGRIPQQIHFESIEKMSLLENRLATLEGRLGTSTGQNLGSQVELLRIKVNALSNAQDLESKVLPRIQAFNREVSMLTDTPLVTRIDELHASVKTVTDLAPHVPLILDRLRSLHKVHENAAESQTRLQAARSAITARAIEIEEWRTALKVIEEHMASFRTIVTQNSDELHTQTKSLLDRLDKPHT